MQSTYPATRACNPLGDARCEFWLRLLLTPRFTCRLLGLLLSIILTLTLRTPNYCAKDLFQCVVCPEELAYDSLSLPLLHGSPRASCVSRRDFWASRGGLGLSSRRSRRSRESNTMEQWVQLSACGRMSHIHSAPGGHAIVCIVSLHVAQLRPKTSLISRVPAVPSLCRMDGDLATARRLSWFLCCSARKWTVRQNSHHGIVPTSAQATRETIRPSVPLLSVVPAMDVECAPARAGVSKSPLFDNLSAASL